MHAQVIASIVWAKRQRSDHRNGVQKENYVAYVGIGNLRVLERLEVRPQELACHPRRHSQSEESPECAAASRWVDHIGKNAYGGEDCGERDGHVAKLSQPRARWDRDGANGERTTERHPRTDD